MPVGARHGVHGLVPVERLHTRRHVHALLGGRARRAPLDVVLNVADEALPVRRAGHIAAEGAVELPHAPGLVPAEPQRELEPEDALRAVARARHAGLGEEDTILAEAVAALVGVQRAGRVALGAEGLGAGEGRAGEAPVDGALLQVHAPLRRARALEQRRVLARRAEEAARVDEVGHGSKVRGLADHVGEGLGEVVRIVPELSPRGPAELHHLGPLQAGGLHPEVRMPRLLALAADRVEAARGQGVVVQAVQGVLRAQEGHVVVVVRVEEGHAPLPLPLPLHDVHLKAGHLDGRPAVTVRHLGRQADGLVHAVVHLARA
mmetsp:Transcript_19291/g.64668  ORF Transcript_19291/g.64668 Transcript_19291/m.64668 type:complete len:319 (+) Transcript_19291:718-1674(+)